MNTLNQAAMAPKSWILDRPDEAVSEADLEALGVECFSLDTTGVLEGSNAEYEELCSDRGYTFRDTVDSSEIDLEKMLQIEHLHDDDEVRFFLQGSGYFDVKNADDEFIRMHCVPGDLISLPKGIYHRFMPDEKKEFYVVRLFQGEPVFEGQDRKN